MMKEQKKEEQQSASFFQELGGFMKPYTGRYTASVLISIVGVVGGLLSYAFAGLIAGEVFSEEISFKMIAGFAVAVILCKVIYALCINISTWISHKAAYFTLRDIRNSMIEKLMKIPLGYFEEAGSGRLKVMLTDNIETMEKTLAHMLPELTANLLAPAALLVWIFIIDWRLGLVVTIWIILGFSVTGGMMKGYEEKFEGQIKAMKNMNQSVVEFVNGIEVIKNFGRADECYKKYEDAVYGHAKYNINWQKSTQIYSALGMSIAPFAIFPVLIAGLIFYGNHTLEPAEFFTVIIMTLGIFKPLMNTMTYYDQMAQMGTQAKEIKGVLEYPEVKRGLENTAKNADIEFDDVTFSYGKDTKNALEHVSFKAKTGQMFALVGPSGSGKSTIAKLLAGYWDPKSGSIKIAGKPMGSYTQELLNRQIAYVDQETFLFDKSIMDNIRMGSLDATDEEVMEAAKKAGCDQFIKELPNGYQTTAGMAGGKLSGGERQRIAIARAMMKDAPIMILDEATASSDPENEAAIQTALSAAAKGRTLIVVAHRLSTIMNADTIAFVNNGRIECTGTHEELLKNCSTYKEMWNLSEEGSAC